LFKEEHAALIPAMRPCAVVYSYPAVPFIWPPRKRLGSFIVERGRVQLAKVEESY
jgi:hypothetical protein